MRQYKEIKIGGTNDGHGNGVIIGGTHPISVQSMCNIPFSRLEELKTQALALQKAGCDILRVSVPDKESAEKFSELKKVLDIPLVADIHFDYTLALASINAGADKIRINPGNIGKNRIAEVAAAAKAKKIPIRVGVNGGSLEKELLKKYGAPTPEALAESALQNVKMLEECGFFDIVVSIKSSDVRTMVETYRIFDEQNTERYPLHLGVTEAGTMLSGTVKGSVGIGTLLLDGIGSTIRYSLTDDPINEIYAAKTLLKSLGLAGGAEIISCPTCGRTTVNSIELASKLEKALSNVEKNIKIAVMGCVVNGIGESREADFGVTGANGKYIIFKKGAENKVEIIKRDISEDEIFGEVLAAVDKLCADRD